MLVIPFTLFDPATGRHKCRNLGPLYREPSAVEGSSDLVIIACAMLLVWQACERSVAGRRCLLLNRPCMCREGQAWVSHAPVLLELGVGLSIACRSVSSCFAFSHEHLTFLFLPFGLFNCIFSLSSWNKKWRGTWAVKHWVRLPIWWLVFYPDLTCMLGWTLNIKYQSVDLCCYFTLTWSASLAGH